MAINKQTTSPSPLPLSTPVTRLSDATAYATPLHFGSPLSTPPLKPIRSRRSRPRRRHSMDALRSRAESWIRDQRERAERLVAAWSPPPPPQWRWPPLWGRGGREEEERRRVQEELERRRKQMDELCRAVKAETVSDLQDVLCSMVLSECVYKKPAAEMIRVINKFKADFGGQVVSLDRVQPSLDHVPHRYLLAEAGDTLYASFIGTKQYKDIMADANILQGVLFHDDDTEDIDSTEATASKNCNNQSKNGEKNMTALPAKPNHSNNKSRPAAHRGFLARAKGIPALELYKLAQKKNRKLVLCGHSLGGAVAALATLAILRVIASASSKEPEKVQVKCITFSQPPVGNAALRDYVQRKGWHHFFKTYCIPEDLVPRILSPAYFHHYNAQPLQSSSKIKLTDQSSIQHQERGKGSMSTKSRENEREQLVLGLGPVQTSFWRLSRLVPLAAVRRHLDRYKAGKQGVEEMLVSVASDLISKSDKMDFPPQSLEIQENFDGISLSPLPKTDSPKEMKTDQTRGKKLSKDDDSQRWARVPHLPSYIPFGELYLLGNSSVDFLSDAEYSKATSVRSVISELRERFQSHSMKSYRARFQKIYDMCMYDHASTFLGLEQTSQFPSLQQWLGLSTIGAVELGHIVEAPVIQSATSILPLGWTGTPGQKNAEPFKIDIMGNGLHLCNLIEAQVNGTWYSTSVESLPSQNCFDCDALSNLQKMRILIGPPLKRSPMHAVVGDSSTPIFSSTTDDFKSSPNFNERSSDEGRNTSNDILNNFVIFCTSDFVTVSKEVYIRTRRVRLIGLEGSGKTSLFTAIMGQSRETNGINLDNLYPQAEAHDGISGGLCYLDSAGVNLQDLQLETNRFREELQLGMHDLTKKTDLIVLVHNLSHKIPQYCQPDGSHAQPALSLLLDEAKVQRVPWVLAITNKYSVSAHQQKMLVRSVMDAYQAVPSMTQVINSCPYVIPSVETASQTKDLTDSGDLSGRMAAQSLIYAPMKIVRMPFRRKVIVMEADGVNALCKLAHGVLRNHEEASLQELARERLSQETARKRAIVVNGRPAPPENGSSTAAAAVGASIGAGVGIILALVMGAASALRKP